MTTTGHEASSKTRYWFGQRDLPVLIYRVNRRPPASGGQGSLFEPPSDVLDHVQQVLRLSGRVETGRRFKRSWRVGNLQAQGGVLTGRVGWARSGESTSDRFDEETQQWMDVNQPVEVTAVAPFAFLAEGRYLGVLLHPTFTATGLASAFTMLFNEGERRLALPTTDWGVDPLADEANFLNWLNDVDSVTRVEYVFRLPNPGAEEQFHELFDRMAAYRARESRQQLIARDETGLAKEAIINDETSRQYRAAAASAYGYMTATGRRGNRKSRFDQRANVAKESIENAPDDWPGVREAVLRALAKAVERRRSG